MPEGRRRGRKVLLPLTALVAAGVAVTHKSRDRHRPGWPYLAGAPLLMAHRGGSKLAPENTFVAFQRAVDWWSADILEMDVQPTRDGEVVVIHDSTLDRTTDGSGRVADHSLDQLRQLDAGYNFSHDAGATFPFRGRGVGLSTLAEVLHGLSRVRINLEIKDGRAQERAWESIREANAQDRVLIAAGDSRNRDRLRGYPAPVSAGKQELRVVVAQLRLGRVVFMPAIDALQVPNIWNGEKIASLEMVKAAQRHNVPVHVWTVDDVEEMNTLLDWGVAGIITDRPDRLARLLHERFGRPLPPGAPNPPPEPFLEYLLRD